MKLLEFFKGKPNRWTKRSFARTVAGVPCAIDSSVAACWCLKGAMYKCHMDGRDMATWERLTNVVASRGFDNPAQFNDDPGTTFDDVISVLEEAGV